MKRTSVWLGLALLGGWLAACAPATSPAGGAATGPSPSATQPPPTTAMGTATAAPSATPGSASVRYEPAPAPTTAFDPQGLAVGPGRGFIVLDDPEVVPGTSATWLDPEEIVLGVVWGGEARAYPVSQMAYHHIANDTLGGLPFLVTY